MTVHRASPSMSGRRFLRRREASAKVGLPASTMYLLINRGEFPKPYRLFGDRINSPVAWLEDELDAWIAERCRR